ncbi:hypothetical protein U1Q18_047077 [Sarracenia purpurea var. burkii]
MLMKLPIWWRDLWYRYDSNRGDFDAFGVIAIDDELEDEEEDDGVEEKEVEEINRSNLTQFVHVDCKLEKASKHGSVFPLSSCCAPLQPTLGWVTYENCQFTIGGNFTADFSPGDDGRLTRPMRVAFLLAKLGGAFAANLLSDLHLGTAGLNI